MKWISFNEQMAPITIIPKGGCINRNGRSVAKMEKPIYLKAGEATYIGEVLKWEGSEMMKMDVNGLFMQDGDKIIPFFTHWAPIEKPED